MLGVAHHGDHPVPARLQGIEDHLRLPATQVQDAGYATRNRVARGRDRVVHEQVVVTGAGATRFLVA